MKTKSLDARARRGSLVATVAGVASLAMLLSGCQGIPTAGSVQTGLSDFSQVHEQVIYRPEMPVPGANEEEIVRGFLQAASSATDDYAIARQYLTRGFSSSWNPYFQAAIDEGVRIFKQDIAGHSQLSISTTATIDEHGVLSNDKPGGITEISFELVRENGEWRINEAPNGIIIDRTTFRDIWVQQMLYFWDEQGYLVTDPRWFLNKQTLGNQILNELLQGPRLELQGAVSSAIPTGTLLASEAVIIEAGQIKADFTKELLDADESAQEKIAAQLGAVFYGVLGVNEFSISVDQAVALSGKVEAAQNYQRPNPTGLNSWPTALIDGEFGFLSTTGFIKDEQMTELINEFQPKHLVARGGQREVLITAKDGKLYWINPVAGVKLLDDRKNQIAPSHDIFNLVWSYSVAEPALIRVGHPGAELEAVPTPWLEELLPSEIRVSPDGTKLALIVKEQGASAVYITGISRDSSGIVNHIVEPEIPVFWVAENAVDLDWIDGQRVAVLTEAQGVSGAPKLVIGGFGFFLEERIAAQGAVALRGASRLSLMQLVDNEGGLWGTQGSLGWQRLESGVSLISKRG